MNELKIMSKMKKNKIKETAFVENKEIKQLFSFSLVNNKLLLKFEKS